MASPSCGRASGESTACAARSRTARGSRRAKPILLGPGERDVLPLTPLASARRPSVHAEPELFLLEGRGRRGVVLVALPAGFEQTSDVALAWLNRVSAVSDDAESAHLALEAPYRGLAPLTAADADIFFGREREVEAFLNRLRTEPLLVVVGPSGAGKSSFVRAGVVPALGERFHAIVLRPGTAPLAALPAKIAQLGLPAEDPATYSHAATHAARVHAVARARDETLVFVVDQFEETFTVARPDERGLFCACLAALATSASDPARVVLTLRDDFPHTPRPRRARSGAACRRRSSSWPRPTPTSCAGSSSSRRGARASPSRARLSSTRWCRPSRAARGPSRSSPSPPRSSGSGAT